MFAGYKDEVDDPTEAAVGIFIPEQELQTWYVLFVLYVYTSSHGYATFCLIKQSFERTPLLIALFIFYGRWKSLQKKFPKIYPPNEPCPQQHPLGTKMMCYILDDPSKPARIEIVGSRWRKDALMGKQAVYVVRRHGAGIETTEFSSAHEDDPYVGWCLGWDHVCPPPDPESE
jgi:hypothetical protein